MFWTFSNEFSNVLNIFELRSELALSQKNMIFRIKITKIEFSVVKLKFPDQKWKIHFLISKMGNTLGVRKKRDPKDGPKPRNHVLLPTKSVKKQWFLAFFFGLKIQSFGSKIACLGPGMRRPGSKVQTCPISRLKLSWLVYTYGTLGIGPMRTL